MRCTKKRLNTLMVSLMTTVVLMAQTRDLKLLDWQPVSQMVVKETKIIKAKFPVININSHLGNLENKAKYLEEIKL